MKGKSTISLVKMREYASKAIKYIEGLDYNDVLLMTQKLLKPVYLI